MKRPRIFVLVFLCFIVGAFTVQTKTVETVDLALINGRVWLGGDSSNFAEAVAVKGNYISQVGSNVEIKKRVDEHTQVIDLGGRLVAPGFNDAHIHFLNGSLGLNEVDLTESRSVAEMIERIAAYAKKNPQAAWITGRGWEYTKFPGGLPTKTYLDAIIKDRPIFLSAYDGHSAWVNSKALALANVTRETRFDGYGEVVKDAAGEPTGALKEGAQSLVRRLLPVATREQKLDALRAGMKLAAALGITSIQNASGTPEEFSLYEELLRRSELTLRVSVAFSVGERTRPEDLERYLAIKNQNDLNPMLKAGSVKFMLDGVIESHTAAMLQQYSDLPPNHGMPLGELTMPSDVYRDLVARIDKLGFQIYTHAIGDRAVREALNAYEFAQKANGRKNTRHRIEHIETISPEDIPRLASLKVLPSMEPIHADPGTAEVWSKAVGAERLPYAFPWAALLRSGAHLVFSSDWPAAISVDPIRGLHCAVNRRTVDGQPPRGWIPEQRISVADALRAYTHGGAYSSYEEGVKGNLAANHLADIVVFSQDLFKIDPMKIHETKVVLTVFNGKVLYSKL
jgi:predicted amidohydrolase YtcJ